MQVNAINPAQITEIVNSRNAHEMLNTEIETSEVLDAEGLSIEVLPIDISALKQVRHIRVEPNSSIPEHAHDTLSSSWKILLKSTGLHVAGLHPSHKEHLQLDCLGLLFGRSYG